MLVIYPMLSIVLLAFHKRSDLVTGFSIPDSLDFDTFQQAWEEGGFDRGLVNSFIVAATVDGRHGGARPRSPATRSARCASAAPTRSSTCC